MKAVIVITDMDNEGPEARKTELIRQIDAELDDIVIEEISPREAKIV